MIRPALLLALMFAVSCGRLAEVGRAPDLTSLDGSAERLAMISPGLPDALEPNRQIDAASLWSGGRGSLLGSSRAAVRGDILTVVIEIDDRAEISNSTQRSRTGKESLGIPSLLGIPQRIDPQLPEGASLGDAVSIASSSNSAGDGTVRRNEKLTLRVAATVVNVLPNGTLQIEGTQEVRVNFEVRELLVSGFVRPEDISRQNEVTYDELAAARISYGGRGQITDVQQPRYGQQIVDAILPF
jgi:flagellar L-ring protein precursor FlgH